MFPYLVQTKFGANQPLRLNLQGNSWLSFPQEINTNFINTLGDRGSTVVKVLCYKSEGRWFDCSWCQWIFH